ncbi:hypothetical protein MMC20_006519 [Loxospora ochrophaea]|nr:hypothetical protein [Loxospora ochrophaea]
MLSIAVPLFFLCHLLLAATAQDDPMMPQSNITTHLPIPDYALIRAQALKDGKIICYNMNTTLPASSIANDCNSAAATVMNASSALTDTSTAQYNVLTNTSGICSAIAILPPHTTLNGTTINNIVQYCSVGFNSNFQLSMGNSSDDSYNPFGPAPIGPPSVLTLNNSMEPAYAVFTGSES